MAPRGPIEEAGEPIGKCDYCHRIGYSPSYASPSTAIIPGLAKNAATISNWRMTMSHNVLDFGADPTGANDSVAAFENAMMATGGLAYGKIVVPLGTYKFSRSCNLEIMGVTTSGRIVMEARVDNRVYWCAKRYPAYWKWDYP
jgi:hypothetical protein